MKRATRNLMLTAIGVTIASQVGCVTSENSRFKEHLTTVIERDAQPNTQVALAFGLNESGHQIRLADASMTE